MRPTGQTTSSPAPADFEEAALIEITGGDRALAAELVGLFLAELAPRLQRIKTAIEQGDTVQLRYSAHSLKGSAGAIAANRVASSAGALESIAASDALVGAPQALLLLEEDVGRLRERLSAMTA